MPCFNRTHCREPDVNRFDRTTKLLLALLVIGVWASLLRPLLGPATAAAEAPRKGGQHFDEITVGRLNVAEADGKVRIVLANTERMPNPVVRGKEYPRSIRPAGIIFYKPDGDECGGVALASTPRAEQAMLIFDYASSEAVGIGKAESKDGKTYEAGLTIVDRVPLDADIEKVGSVGTRRFEVSTENKNCRLALAAPDGKDRIVLSVDAAGEAKLQVLDKEGKVVFSAPK
jgi:hypothetical protein